MERLRSYRAARMGMMVRRLHTEGMMHQQTVGQHTSGMLLTAMHLSAKTGFPLREQLLRWIILHDVAEYGVGDIPATTKWRAPNISELLDSLENRWLQENDITLPFISDEEFAFAKLCDGLDLLYTSYEELMQGNRWAANVYQRILDAVVKRAEKEEPKLRLAVLEAIQFCQHDVEELGLSHPYADVGLSQ